ncbi:LysR family transcriptional regulator [Thiothrix litoralis]|uniref:LysR family transcriptional regulator n=1 Tax=Thiothrix litoralis TaxID=2891210 RepID=A0ABX7WPG7_9GAMM|nr:LysR family transcriptional regulator [Thiothrix litoralis]QTR44807.1 LysR family transcriptional regulator [Thiothrix litoralis]
MKQANVSTELLQTFVTVVESGGFIRAAQHLYKTQSTISQQIRKLETELNTALFATAGRRRVLTSAGEQFLGYAKRWLALQDEALFSLAQTSITADIRLGVSHSLSEGILPELLAQFSRTYPHVNMIVETGYGNDLIQRYDSGDYDLILTLEREPLAGKVMGTTAMVWIGKAGSEWPSFHPMRLAGYQGACEFRQAATHALDQAGIPWQVVYSTNSLAALMAAVRAGLAVTVRAHCAVSAGLVMLTPPPVVPELPTINVVLRNRTVSEASEWLAEALQKTGLPAA